jgi:hypothetical protein
LSAWKSEQKGGDINLAGRGDAEQCCLMFGGVKACQGISSQVAAIRAAGQAKSAKLDRPEQSRIERDVKWDLRWHGQV